MYCIANEFKSTTEVESVLSKKLKKTDVKTIIRRNSCIKLNLAENFIFANKHCFLY